MTSQSVEECAAVSSWWSPIARQLWRMRSEEDFSADILSLYFTFGAKGVPYTRLPSAAKRGTLAIGDTPTATALESIVSRLLLVLFFGSGVWDISSRPCLPQLWASDIRETLRILLQRSEGVGVTWTPCRSGDEC